MAYDIKKLIEKYTVEGVLNEQDANNDLQNQLNGILAKNKPNEEDMKTKFKSEFENDIFKGLGIEGITNTEQFKTHVETISKSTDENARLVTKLQNDLTEKVTAYETLETNLKTTKSESETSAFKLDVYEEKYNPKYMTSIKAEFESMTKDLEEFDKKDIHSKLKEKFPEFISGFNADSNFGNRKPNDNRKPGFGNSDSKPGFYGNKVNPN